MTTLEEGFRNDIGTGQLHDMDSGRHEVAVDFPHEVIDSYRTDWGRNCWDRSFARRLPVMVVNHESNNLIGSASKGECLGDRTRLIGRFADLDKVPKAGETFSLLSDGHYPGWSFHFINGESVTHPDVRGARRFVQADMLEFCPVPFPSIPGATHVGLRAEEAFTTMAVPTIKELQDMVASGDLEPEGMRAMVAKHYPDLSEYIIVRPPSDDVVLARLRSDAIAKYGPEVGSRVALNVGTLGQEGTTDPKKGATPQSPGDKTDPVTAAAGPAASHAKTAKQGATEGSPADHEKALAGAHGEPAGTLGDLATKCEKCASTGDGTVGEAHLTADHDKYLAEGKIKVAGTGDDLQGQRELISDLGDALVEANRFLADTDLRSLPEPVQKALAITQASEVAVIELMEVMGIEHDGDRAALTAEERNNLPDEDFGYIEPGAKKGGPKDEENGFHFPIANPVHVRNALTRIAQGAKFADEAKPKVVARAKKFGIKVAGEEDGSGDGKRSEEVANDIAARFDNLSKPRAVRSAS